MEPVTIYGKVHDARYYPDEKCIAILIEDIKAERVLRPVQIHASSFSFPDPSKVDEEMEKTAFLMKHAKFPIRIVFDPKTLDEERAWYGDANAIKSVFGDEWHNYIKTLADIG